MGQATIRSMTGFGRGTGQSPLGQFTAELRTVNNRYHDASVALPRELQPLEMRLRTLLKQRVPRGKVDCRVRWVPAQAQLPTVELNLPLAEAYHERLRQLAALTGEKQVPLQLLTTLPGVLEIGALDIDEEQLWGSLEPVLKSALQASCALNWRRSRRARTKWSPFSASASACASSSSSPNSRAGWNPAVSKWRSPFSPTAPT